MCILFVLFLWRTLTDAIFHWHPLHFTPLHGVNSTVLSSLYALASPYVALSSCPTTVSLYIAFLVQTKNLCPLLLHMDSYLQLEKPRDGALRCLAHGLQPKMASQCYFGILLLAGSSLNSPSLFSVNMGPFLHQGTILPILAFFILLS